jgi:Family of unknown function (DUF6326)
MSTLWIVVLFSMVFADVLSFITPGFQETGSVHVTQELLLVFAILLEVPILMVFLSRVLPHRANRVANIVAGVVTIVFTIGGGSLYLHYVFFAAVEVVCMALIIRYAWQWRAPERSVAGRG